MESSRRLQADLASAMGGDSALTSADRLCRACVDLLQVDGAAISFVHQGLNSVTFGSSDATSRRWDEFQFTFGEGPCLEAVRTGQPQANGDLADPEQARWPVFAQAMLNEGVRGVFAFPVNVAATRVGALDLFRRTSGILEEEIWEGANYAARLAGLSFFEVVNAEVDWGNIAEGGAWPQLESLERVEVYQATGMVQVQLGVDAPEALVRIRGYAFAHDKSINEVAWLIVEKKLSFRPDQFGISFDDPGGPRP